MTNLQETLDGFTCMQCEQYIQDSQGKMNFCEPCDKQLLKKITEEVEEIFNDEMICQQQSRIKFKFLTTKTLISRELTKKGRADGEI